jgi:hypothetical protein
MISQALVWVYLYTHLAGRRYSKIGRPRTLQRQTPELQEFKLAFHLTSSLLSPLLLSTYTMH